MEGLTALVVWSRRLNRLLLGEDEMLCARAHRRGWWAFYYPIDAVFSIILLRSRGWHRHCQEMYRWERRFGLDHETPPLLIMKFSVRLRQICTSPKRTEKT